MEEKLFYLSLSPNKIYKTLTKNVLNNFKIFSLYQNVCFIKTVCIPIFVRGNVQLLLKNLRLFIA